jgi:hypothetical protein
MIDCLGISSDVKSKERPADSKDLVTGGKASTPKLIRAESFHICVPPLKRTNCWTFGPEPIRPQTTFNYIAGSSPKSPRHTHRIDAAGSEQIGKRRYLPFASRATILSSENLPQRRQLDAVCVLLNFC